MSTVTIGYRQAQERKKLVNQIFIKFVEEFVHRLEFAGACIFLSYSEMVSDKTLSMTVSVIRTACFLKLFPAVWDQEASCLMLENNKEYKFGCIRVCLGKKFQVIHIILPIYILLYVAMFLIFYNEHNFMDLYFSIIVITGMSLTLMAQINFYYWLNDICTVFNSILVLDQKLRK